MEENNIICGSFAGKTKEVKLWSFLASSAYYFFTLVYYCCVGKDEELFSLSEIQFPVVQF